MGVERVVRCLCGVLLVLTLLNLVAWKLANEQFCQLEDRLQRAEAQQRNRDAELFTLGDHEVWTVELAKRNHGLSVPPSKVRMESPPK